MSTKEEQKTRKNSFECGKNFRCRSLEREPTNFVRGVETKIEIEDHRSPAEPEIGAELGIM